MAKIIIASNSNFFNTGVDVSVFYDKATKSLAFFDEGKLPKNRKRFIQTPSVNEIKPHTFKIFHEILSDKEREIADSYPYKRGYFNYLRENDLIQAFYDAQEMAAHYVAEEWAKINGLDIEWKF